MSKNFEFKLNRDGVRELLKSDEVSTMLDEYATKIKERAGDGFAQKSTKGNTRASAVVYADSPKGFFRNLRGNVLLKAMK